MNSAAIGPADLLRAFAALAPADAETEVAIRRLLGIRLVARAAAVGDDPIASLDDGPSACAPSRWFAEPKLPAVRRMPGSAAGDRRPVPIRIRRLALDQLEGGMGSGLADVRPLPAVAVGPASGVVEPLLEAPYQRAVLGTLVSVRRPGREIDVGRLVGELSRARPTVRIPRRERFRPAGSVLVLIDASSRMAPYRLDAEQIVVELRRWVGSERLKAFRFGRSLDGPYFDVAGGDPTERIPADRGTVVLALTRLTGPSELDHGAPSASDWGDVSRQLRSVGARLVVLAPCRPAEIARLRSHSVTAVEWDRATTPTVADAVRAGPP